MRKRTLFWGIALVVIGLLVLLDNLGYFGNINVWNLIWPIFLIGIGAWILLGALFRGSSQSEHVVVPLEGANRANLRLQHGAGRLRVLGGTSHEALIEGDFGGGLDYQTRREADLLNADLRPLRTSFPFLGVPGESFDWHISLNTNILLNLVLETGASDNRLDLSKLQIKDLRLKSGASSIVLILPANAGHTRVEVEAGAASLEIEVPEGVAAQIHTNSAISSIKINANRFPRVERVYSSPDYDSALNKVDIHIQMGMGSVVIN